MQTKKTCGERSRTIKQLQKELNNETEIVRCAKEFNLVGDPTRLKTCYLLCRHQQLSVGEIAEIIDISISAVSHTLRKLKEANIVENRQDFRHVYYQLKQSPLAEIIKRRLEKI